MNSLKCADLFYNFLPELQIKPRRNKEDNNRYTIIKRLWKKEEKKGVVIDLSLGINQGEKSMLFHSE